MERIKKIGYDYEAKLNELFNKVEELEILFSNVETNEDFEFAIANLDVGTLKEVVDDLKQSLNDYSKNAKEIVKLIGQIEDKLDSEDDEKLVSDIDSYLETALKRIKNLEKETVKFFEWMTTSLDKFRDNLDREIDKMEDMVYDLADKVDEVFIELNL